MTDGESDGRGFEPGGATGRGRRRRHAAAAGTRQTLLTVNEAAEILRVCAATVYSMVERGELVHVRVSNAIRIVVSSRRNTGRPPTIGT